MKPSLNVRIVIVTVLTFASLIFGLLALTLASPFHIIFGMPAILCGAMGLILNRLIWKGGKA